MSTETISQIDIDRSVGELNIILRDGQTAAIGGLVDTTTRKEDSRVPLLGDMPVLGALFRNTNHRTQRSNLLLFLTPYIIRDQSDFRRIFERKMQERQEFLDRYFAAAAAFFAQIGRAHV